jgi:hypothetical protein
MHRKNVLDVCKMYLEKLGQYGFWVQLRVDHGREFFLILYLQHNFQDPRTNDLFIKLKNFLVNLKIITFLIKK